MANTLLLRTEVIKSITVETVKELQDALSSMQDPSDDFRRLGTDCLVELICSTLSEGSEVMEVYIRPVTD
jgi:hypothetical protein